MSWGYIVMALSVTLHASLRTVEGGNPFVNVHGLIQKVDARINDKGEKEEEIQ